MSTIWKLFTGDIKRLTSNVVSIIIVIGLVMIPGLFTLSLIHISEPTRPY